MSRQFIQLKKRGEIWYYSFTTPNGERICRSTQIANKNAAKELATAVYNEVWRTQKLGDKPLYTWQEAVVEWLNEKPERKTSNNVRYSLRWLDKYLDNKRLVEIDRDLVAHIRQEKAKEGVKNRTINAVLQQIRGVLRLALDLDMVDKIPQIKLLAESQGRIRWLTEEEEEYLLYQLPHHLKGIVKFALSTGLRMSNITQLKWSQVDLKKCQAWIHADESKTRKAIGIPMNGDAINVLLKQKGEHDEFVFTYNGKPIKNANVNAYKKAVKRAGLGNFTFHDLRHTWATRHILSGTPLYALRDLGGWSSDKTVRKYAHLSVQYLQSHANNVSKIDTNLAQEFLQ